MVLLSFDFPRNCSSTSNTHIPALCVILQTIPFSRLYYSPGYTVLQSIPFDRLYHSSENYSSDNHHSKLGRLRRWVNSEAPSARCAVARTLHQSFPMAQSPPLRHRSRKSQWRLPARRPRKSQKSRSRLLARRPSPPALLPRPMSLSCKYRRNPNPLSARQPSIKLPFLLQRQQQQQRQQQ